MITLTPRYKFKVPIDGENISPDTFAKKSIDKIKQLKVWEGNREKKLDNLFQMNFQESIQSKDLDIHLVGDFTKVKRIGTKMSTGRIMIKGDVGMRLGESMRGGAVTVLGNSDSWTGMMMKDGIIEIFGDTGDYLGAAYRGSKIGMKKGTIIIHGNAGNEIGCFMNNGLIKVDGDVGQFAGVHMSNGTIFIKGNTGVRLGASMAGGKIIVLGSVPSILPSFNINRITKNVRINKDSVKGPFYLFKGDITESWEGSLYIATEKNPHFKIYENKIL